MFHNVFQWNTLLETPHGPSPSERMKCQGRGYSQIHGAIFKCFLATESVRGTKLEVCGMMNKGAWSDAG